MDVMTVSLSNDLLHIMLPQTGRQLLRVSLAMRAGKNGNTGILNVVPDQEREAVQHGSADVSIPQGINDRSFCEPVQSVVELDIEFCRQTSCCSSYHFWASTTSRSAAPRT